MCIFAYMVEKERREKNYVVRYQDRGGEVDRVTFESILLRFVVVVVVVYTLLFCVCECVSISRQKLSFKNSLSASRFVLFDSKARVLE